jgi:hypothetical protein
MLHGNSQKPARTIDTDDSSASRGLHSYVVGYDTLGIHLSADLAKLFRKIISGGH